MYKKLWFKFLVWFTAATYFLLFSALIISGFTLGVTEQEVDLWMSGMMSAMHNSLMGVAMHGEGRQSLNQIVSCSALLIPLSAAAGYFIALTLQIRRRSNG